MKLFLSRFLGIIPPDVKDIESLRKTMPKTQPVGPPNHCDQIDALDTLGRKAASCATVAGGLVIRLTGGDF